MLLVAPHVVAQTNGLIEVLSTILTLQSVCISWLLSSQLHRSLKKALAAFTTDHPIVATNGLVSTHNTCLAAMHAVDILNRRAFVLVPLSLHWHPARPCS